MPVVQVAWALVAPGQDVPQPLQLATSFVRFLHPFGGQSVWPAAQRLTQTALVHTSVLRLQLVPQQVCEVAPQGVHFAAEPQVNPFPHGVAPLQQT